MGYNFNANEIFAIAEQIEVNGAKYYRQAANYASDQAAKSILEELASVEDAHKLIFASMRKNIAEKGTETFDPNGEVEAYLKAMASGKVFDMKKNAFEELGANPSIDAIFRKAIELEKDSIVFYVAIKELVPGHLGKDKINGIIKEELSHVNMLVGELKSFES